MGIKEKGREKGHVVMLLMMLDARAKAIVGEGRRWVDVQESVEGVLGRSTTVDAGEVDDGWCWGGRRQLVLRQGWCQYCHGISKLCGGGGT